MNSYLDIAPNQTLYVNNLNMKLHTNELKRSLYELFGQYGAILEIVARRRPANLRGQAFIVFRDLSSATNAKNRLNSFPFYDRSLRVNYAKETSDAVLKLDQN